MNFCAFGFVILGISTYAEAARLVTASVPSATGIFFQSPPDLGSLQTVEGGNVFANVWKILKLKVQTAHDSIYDPRSYWAKWLPFNPKNPWTLYKKLMRKRDCFVDLRDTLVEKEDLKSSDDAKILLYKYGYLKEERPDVRCTPADNKFEFGLYADLVSAAQSEDYLVAGAISEIKSTFQRMPPRIVDFKSSMLALDTLLRGIPRIFIKKWEIATVVGALYASGLDNFTVTTGPTANSEFLSCEGLPDNTRMQMLVHFSDYNTTQDTFSVLDELPKLSEMITEMEKILRIVIIIGRYRDNNANIHDWYAEYQQFVCSVYPRACSAEQNNTTTASPPNKTDKLRALYNKLKQIPKCYLESMVVEVERADLESQRMNSSDDLRVILYEHGYLSMTDVSVSRKDEENCTLEFRYNSEFKLYIELIWYVAREEDKIVENATSKIKSTFERMPPETGDFKSFIHSLETVLSRIPRLFDEWQLPVLFSCLYLSRLKVNVGGSLIDNRIIYCNELPNNTYMRIVVDFYYTNASQGWESQYKELLLPGLLGLPRRQLLAAVISFPSFRKHDTRLPFILDWYGEFQSLQGEVLREYRP